MEAHIDRPSAVWVLAIGRIDAVLEERLGQRDQFGHLRHAKVHRAKCRQVSAHRAQPCADQP